jgi:hypothetical protein
MADGPGTLTWFVKNNEVAKYTNVVQKGNQNGKGKLIFPTGMIQEGNFIEGIMNGQDKIIFPDTTIIIDGNFVDGEILNLDTAYLNELEKIFISKKDSTDLYINDHN